MSGFVVVAVVGLLLLWVARKRARARVLAGLVATRPTFTVEPPARRVGARKREAL